MPSFERLEDMVLWGIVEKYKPQLKEYAREAKVGLATILDNVLEAHL
jgi:hypothetical protein